MAARTFRLRSLLWLLLGLLILALLAAGLHWRAKLPKREGELQLRGLSQAVSVRFDAWGVPHVEAQNETDLYRALGYLHAQDRLFQMEMARRLARGELSEVLGEKLLPTDKLFRSLRLIDFAEARVKAESTRPPGPAQQALLAYLDGVNQYQATRPAPLEFELLGIPKRDFTPVDTYAVAGYLAYSFASAFRTEPALTYVRDQLGPEYLKIFDLDWKPEGALAARARLSAPAASAVAAGRRLQPADWQALARIGQLSDSLGTGLAQMEGSNAWAISGARTASGKPLLAGDPHIGFSTPAVWWEAHLKAPGFELYGHLQVLNPFALIGHNQRFGWSLTMFQNDDIDLVAEKTDAAHPGQVLVKGAWLPLESREARIKVKGRADEVIQLRRSPHGPIVNDVVPGDTGRTPIALWWTFLESENPIIEAFYQLNRADTLGAARAAVQGIHSPGLNVVWANAAGDIAWWASARLPQRPAGVNPSFILDGSSAEADKPGFLPFSANPQEENPARGYIVSANHQPASTEPVPGYYNLPDRGWRLEEGLKASATGWDMARAQALQLADDTGYGPRVLAPLMPILRQQKDGAELVALLAAWKGNHGLEDRAPVLFHQLEHQLIHAVLADKMDEAMLENLTRTRALDHALPRLVADPDSPWWDRKATPQRETREQIVAEAWAATLQHLRRTFGEDPAQWTWGRAHSITHKHPLGEVKALAPLFNVGPFPAPGAHEVPNNLAQRSGDAPWFVIYGPSTRRVIDFAAPGRSRGINPVGQSGVLGDRHYSDQARDYLAGRSRAQWLDAADVQAQARSSLTFRP